MIFKRILRFGDSGSDVLYIKEKLFRLGYFAPAVKTVEKRSFGKDTRHAVIAFQSANKGEDGESLLPDGVIGARTWSSIESASNVERSSVIPSNIGLVAATAIEPWLERVTKDRKAFLLTALSFAFDPAIPAEYPHSLYIRGGNLYNTDLSLNVVTPSMIEAGAKRQPAYYSGGRKEMMLAAVKSDPSITGADCSGGIVGLMRMYGFVKPRFDKTADALSGDGLSRGITKAELEAGDWVARSEHIGIYAGGGYVVEWMGGAYGCQLSKLSQRAGYDFVSHKTKVRSPWTRFRKPDAY
jgi:peptidoglycan hydrolase-like protein with peptidoglycan-binding domain